MSLFLLQHLAGERWAIDAQWLAFMADIAQRNTEAFPPTETTWKASANILAASGGRLLEGTKTVMVQNGIAMIPVLGPIFPYANMMTAYSGATSLNTVASDFRAALADESVQQIVLMVDSPGGVVTGIHEFAGEVFNARGVKPVTAYVSGRGASAAYWISTAADKIVVDPTAMVGSIGVAVVTSVQEQPDSNGFRQIEIVSSNAENKRPDMTSEAGQAEIRQALDSIETVFIGDVAKFRGVSVETVMSDFGRGGVKVGRDAVAAKMADKVRTFGALFSEMQKDIKASTIRSGVRPLAPRALDVRQRDLDNRKISEEIP